jgi:hypothetical protein
MATKKTRRGRPTGKKTQGNISGYTHVVEFVVESAGVADGLSVLVASPEGRGGCLAVGAARPGPPGRALQTQSSFGFDERPVLSIHLVVKSARIAEVVSCSVASPQRRARRTAIDALPTLGAGSRLVAWFVW